MSTYGDYISCHKILIFFPIYIKVSLKLFHKEVAGQHYRAPAINYIKFNFIARQTPSSPRHRKLKGLEKRLFYIRKGDKRRKETQHLSK